MDPVHDRLTDDTSNCPIALTLEVVGEKWTLLILRETLYGVARFDDFQRILGCASNLLAARLALLVEHGVLSVEQYQEPGQRPRPQYVLTEKGAALMPVITALQLWGDRYRPDPKGQVAVVKHRDCGAEVQLSLHCAKGHEIHGAAEAEITRGPGARRKA